MIKMFVIQGESAVSRQDAERVLARKFNEWAAEHVGWYVTHWLEPFRFYDYCPHIVSISFFAEDMSGKTPVPLPKEEIKVAPQPLVHMHNAWRLSRYCDATGDLKHSGHAEEVTCPNCQKQLEAMRQISRVSSLDGKGFDPKMTLSDVPY